MISLIMDKWAEADSEFEPPVDIIKLAQNKQRLRHQDEYREALKWVV